MPKCILDYHLDKQKEMIRAYPRRIPAVPDFTSIHKRVNKLDITIDDSTNDSDEEYCFGNRQYRN